MQVRVARNGVEYRPDHSRSWLGWRTLAGRVRLAVQDQGNYTILSVQDSHKCSGSVRGSVEVNPLLKATPLT